MGKKRAECADTKRVLIAEGDKDWIEYIRAAIFYASKTLNTPVGIVVASSKADALHEAQRTYPNIIITDLYFPVEGRFNMNISAAEHMEYINQLNSRGNRGIAVLSANKEPEAYLGGLVNAYLLKKTISCQMGRDKIVYHTDLACCIAGLMQDSNFRFKRKIKGWHRLGEMSGMEQRDRTPFDQEYNNTADSVIHVGEQIRKGQRFYKE